MADEIDDAPESDVTEQLAGADAAPLDGAKPGPVTDPKAEGEAKPMGEVRALPARSAASRDLPHVMTRIFDVPLLIDAGKLDVIMGALGRRLNLVLGMPAVVTAKGPADVSGVKPGTLAVMEDGDAIQTGPLVLSGDDEDDDACPYEVTSDGIALISVGGTLVYKSSWLSAMSGMTAYASVQDAVAQAMSNPAVMGVLLQVGSNGGEANGCFDTSDAIFAMRATKPIYGVATDNAYSGAYALLSAASRIFVSRTSGVGSIGVCCVHVDQSAADKMDGLKYSYVYSGDRKIDANPHAPLSAEARDVLQAESDRIRQLFAGSVAKYRGLSVDAVLGTQAAMFFGENAVAAKLADAMGTPAEALAALRADLAAKAQANILRIEPPVAAPATVDAPAARPDNTQPRQGEVIDLAAVRDLAVGDAATLHAEIVGLCILAGAPQMASEFITSKAGLEDVRAKLQAIRAQASDARSTQGHILPDADINPARSAAASWEHAIVAVRGKLKGK